MNQRKLDKEVDILLPRSTQLEYYPKNTTHVCSITHSSRIVITNHMSVMNNSVSNNYEISYVNRSPDPFMKNLTEFALIYGETRPKHGFGSGSKLDLT